MGCRFFFLSDFWNDLKSKTAKKRIEPSIQRRETGRRGERSQGKIGWEAENPKKIRTHKVINRQKSYNCPFLCVFNHCILIIGFRNKSKESLRIVDGRAMVVGELQTEVFGSKRSGSKRFSWGKLSWKASDQVECAICLEGFKAGESLVHLPCAHRFHSRCLMPWLETNAHCPCCRMGIFVS